MTGKGSCGPQEPVQWSADATPAATPWQRALRGEERAASPFVPPAPATVAVPGARVAAAGQPSGRAPIDQLHIATYVAASDRLRQGRRPDAVVAIVKEAKARADRAWGGLAAEVEAAGPAPIACRAGCAWCCHQPVAILPAEALAIAAFLRRTMAPTALSALIERLPTTAHAPAVAKPVQPLDRRACRFLDDRRCRIYPARPFRCRGVLSRDVGACRWDAEHPGAPPSARPPGSAGRPFVTPAAKLADAAARGVAAACFEAGLDATNLELGPGVRLALTTVDAAQRYCAGETLFAAAALAPSAPRPGPDDAGRFPAATTSGELR